jgi:hypothetical protein
MMVLIDQSRGDLETRPSVEITIRFNKGDLENLGQAGVQALYSSDVQTVLDQVAPAHLFLTLAVKKKDAEG